MSRHHRHTGDVPGRQDVDRAFAGLLLERERELGSIAERASRVRQDGAGLIMLTGPSGAGKTRLLAEARARAAPGLRVLDVSADELEQDISLGVAERLVGLPSTAGGTSTVRPGAPTVAGDGTGSTGAGSRRRPGDPPRPPAELIRSLTGTVAEQAARQPLMLCLDDAHWADPATLQWLGYLLRRCAALPVLVAVTYQAARRAPGPDVFDEWAGGPRVTLHRLAPLSVAAVSAVVAEVLGPSDAEFCAACHRHTGGNPKLLRALLYRLVDSGTAGRRSELDAVAAGMAVPIAVLLSGLLRGWSARTANFVRAAAALGDGAECGQVAMVAGVEPGAIPEIVRDLVDADLVDERDAGLWFRHPLAPATLLSLLPEPERAALHEHAARALDQTGAPAASVARHLLRIPPRDEGWIARRLCEAAGGELDRGAPAAAVDFLRRALAQPLPAEARREVLLRLGAAASVTNPNQAAGYLSVALAEPAGPESAVPAALLLPDVLAHAGRAAEAVDVFADLLARLEPADRETAEVLAAHRLLVRRESVPAPPAGAVPVPVAPPGLGPAGRAAYSGVLALATAARPDGRDRATALARQAVAAGLPPPAALPSALAAAATLMYADRLDEAESWLDRIIDVTRRAAPLLWARATGYRARCAYRRGDLAGAAAEAERALALLAQGGRYRFQLFALPTLVRCLTEQDRLTEAAALAQGPWPATVEAAPQWGDFLYARGLLRLARRDVRGCLDDLFECGRSQVTWGIDNPAWLGWRTAAVRAYRLSGDLRQARALAAEELALARTWGSSRVLGVALHSAATVAERDVLPGLEEAVHVLECSPARLELARALVDLGGAQVAHGQSRLARETLRRALDQAQRCGSVRTAEWAHQQLLVAGARPRRLAFSGVRALTKSEHQVAELAAKGLTNREIAKSLFVTQRTVELHLTRVYRKTGVPGRAKLAAVLEPEPTR